MLTAKFDPQSFFQRTENIALHVPASEVFSLLKRTIELPPQWGALVGRETGDHAAISAGGVIEADSMADILGVRLARVSDVLFVRLVPLDLKFHLDSLSSKDGFSFEADVQTRVELLPDKAELAVFLHNIVGNRRVIQVESLTAKIQPSVQGALAAFAGEREASRLADATQWHSAGEVVAAALQLVFFSAGLSSLSAPLVRFESSMYRGVQKAKEDAAVRQVQNEAARQVNQAMHAARAEHMDNLSQSLARLKELAAASPAVPLPELIRTFSDHQRGQLYEALFATDSPARQTQWIVAACSDELLFFDARSPGPPARRLRIDGPPGPARSVQVVDHPMLLIGAARGVYAWPVDRAAPERMFIVEEDHVPRGGFNSVVQCGNTLVATHSELGICGWEWGNGRPLPPRFPDLTRGAQAIRNVTLLDDQLYCSIDDRIIQWPVGGGMSTEPGAIFSGAGSMISAMQPSHEGLFAGTSGGDLLFWPTGTTDMPEVLQRGMSRPIESIWIQTVHGVRRVVFADTSPRIHARVVGDSFTMHYEAGGQTLRRVEVADDILVGMNELRDRLFCWTPSKPDHPACVISVGALSGRNVQDFCLVRAAASA